MLVNNLRLFPLAGSADHVPADKPQGWFCTGYKTSKCDRLFPSLSSLVSHCCTSKQPQTPSSNQKSRLFPNSLCLKHTSFVFRANCFSSCKTQLNCPLLQETNYFPTGYPQHIIMVPSSTHVSIPASPIAHGGVDSHTSKYNSTLYFQSQKTVSTYKSLVIGWVHRWTKQWISKQMNNWTNGRTFWLLSGEGRVFV